MAGVTASASVAPHPTNRTAHRNSRLRTRSASSGPASRQKWTSNPAAIRSGSKDISNSKNGPAAVFHDYHHHSFDHTHDREYQRWLADLTARAGNPAKLAVGGRSAPTDSQRSRLPQNTKFVEIDLDGGDARLREAVAGRSLVIHTAGPFQQRTDPALLRAAIAEYYHT